MLLLSLEKWVHRRAFGLLVLCGLLCLGGTTWAKKKQPPARKAADKAKGETPKPDVPDDAFSAMNVQLPTLTRLTSANGMNRLRELMRDWSRQIKKKQSGQAKTTLKALKEMRFNLGYNNLFGASQMLMRAAAQAERIGDSSRALKLYRDASALAPELAEPHYRWAWLTLRSDPAKIYRVVKTTYQGIKLQSRDIFGVTSLMMNALRCLAWVLGFAFVLFWIVLLLRSLRLFQSDFRDLFPHGVTNFQIQLLSLFLLFLPLLMGAGLLETLLCWIAISWFYQTKGERILTTFGLLLLSAAPYAADWAGRLTSLAGSPVASIYMLDRSELGARDAYRLEELARSRKWRKNTELLWALGLHFKRQGDFFKARAYYKRALRSRKNPAIMINLANLDLINQRARVAYNAYTKALKRGGVPEGMYNLSVLYQYSKSTDTNIVSQKVHALTSARAAGGEKIERFVRQTKKQANRFIMDAQIPRGYYLRSLWMLPENQALKQQLWAYAATWIPVASAPWVGLAMLLLLWILLPLGSRFFCGFPCDQCGEVIGRREQQGNKRETQCTQCLEMSGKRDGISPERRVKKELEIQRFRRRRSYLMLAFAVVIPGAGQLMQEETRRGFFILLLVAVALFVWLFQLPMLVHPLALGTPVSFVWQLIWAALAGILYLRALRDVYQDR